MKTAITWETYDGETHGYCDDGSEVSISAATRATPWEPHASNVRTWRVADADNETVAAGTAPGLRAAKQAALAVLTESADTTANQQVEGCPS